MFGSSSSDSRAGGGGVAVDRGVAIGAREEADDSGGGLIVKDAAKLASGWVFSIAGGLSVVECFPVVQGGMERNSSKVRTRGLQHFQPVEVSIVSRGNTNRFSALKQRE